MDTSQFSTVEQFVQKYPAFTVGGVRWLLFNRAQNGFDAAVVQLGRKILIDDQAAVAWLRTNKASAR
jgi:hypothetical protein